MKEHIKTIQATPTLSKEESQKIIKEAMTLPSKEVIEFNEKRLSDSKKVFKD